jgi:hypothetical protein
MGFIRPQTGLAALLLWVSAAAAIGQLAPPEGFFLRTSTHVGVGNVLRVGISSDGVHFTDLFLRPTLTNYSRDASVAKHGGHYMVAYTDQFFSTNGTFGVAASANLIDWVHVASPRAVNPTLITNMINNTWAPEWFVEDGRHYIVVRVSTTTNSVPTGSDTLLSPGHGLPFPGPAWRSLIIQQRGKKRHRSAQAEAVLFSQQRITPICHDDG